MTRIEELDIEINKIYEKLEALDNAEVDLEESYEEYERRREPHYKKLGILSREKRSIMIPEFEEIPDYGDVMSIEHFVECCKCGGFIDYDGSGNYARDGKMSNISIRPSDIKYNAVRTDFDSVVWFNK
jgi:hypothetical protein